MFDARVLHGTGVNTLDDPRFVLNAGFMRSYLRQQDNYCLGLRADVLARASDEALRRMGFQAAGALGTVDGHGFGSSPKTGDPKATVRLYREALEQGAHEPVGELRPDMRDLEERGFTFRESGSYLFGSGLSGPRGKSVLAASEE